MSDLFNSFLTPDSLQFLIRLLIDFTSIFILVGLVYYNIHKNKDYLFTFGLFNALIFLLSALLSSSTIDLGFAFGLFAVFSFIRYRTVTVPIKEMGYLFASVALGLINALGSVEEGYMVIILSNVLILLATIVLDRFVNLSHENSKMVTYEKIDLISPEKRKEMVADLIKRTGLPIHRVEVRTINFLRDTAEIVIFYYSLESENAIIGELL